MQAFYVQKVSASQRLQVRAAASSQDEGIDVEQLVNDLRERVRLTGFSKHLADFLIDQDADDTLSNLLQWDRVENKTAVAVYGVGAVVLLWFSSTIVSAVNSVPLVNTVNSKLAHPFGG